MNISKLNISRLESLTGDVFTVADKAFVFPNRGKTVKDVKAELAEKPRTEYMSKWVSQIGLYGWTLSFVAILIISSFSSVLFAATLSDPRGWWLCIAVAIANTVILAALENNIKAEHVHRKFVRRLKRCARKNDRQEANDIIPQYWFKSLGRG